MATSTRRWFFPGPGANRSVLNQEKSILWVFLRMVTGLIGALLVLLLLIRSFSGYSETPLREGAPPRAVQSPTPAQEQNANFGPSSESPSR